MAQPLEKPAALREDLALGSQPPLTAAPGDPTSSSGLCEAYMRMLKVEDFQTAPTN